MARSPFEGRMGCGMFLLLFLFLGFFTAAGLFSLYLGLTGQVEAEGGGDGSMGALAIGALFTLVGGGGQIGVLLAYLFPRSSSVRGPETPHPRAIEENPCFPKLKVKRGGAGVRLSASATPFTMFIGFSIAALIWNGITWGIMILGDVGTFGRVFLSIFALVGLLIAYGAIHSLLRCLMVGMTLVDVSREPLRPGERFRVSVYQEGSFPITSVEVALECQESATYRVGTDSTTVRETVHTAALGRLEGIRAQGSSTPILTCDARVPDDAMHSFKSSNNEIEWRIVVKMDIPRRPDVKDTFPFRVAPERL